MALDIRSFFVGIATVVGLLAVGFGSGIMMGGVISGDQKAGDQKAPSKIERQAGKEPAGSFVKDVQPAARAEPQPKDPGELARDLDAIKPTSQPTVVTPAAKSGPAPQQTQPAPGPMPQPVSTQPALPATPPPAPPAPKAIAEAPAQPVPAPPLQATQQAAVPPNLAAQKPVSLVQPADQQFSLSRREQARLRAQQRREERAQRRELRRQQTAERRAQEQQRREAERAAMQTRQSVDDDDDDEAPVVVRRERPFELPFFRMFR